MNVTLSRTSHLTSSRAPAAVSWGPGRIDIFARTTGTNGLFQKVYANSWQPTWYDMSISGITSAPAVASSGVGQLDIYLRGVADDLRHRSYTAATGWSAWTNAAGTITAGTGAAPAATNADYPGYTFLVLRDTRSGLRYRPLSN